ncbi:MAG: response regulator transcription factor [Candidatus Paraimprobicoccus trichonymphae]|uniref:Stage 0 sporulation protein A homolog n=1 Tax=Candidatus Paraimprobicoccus trichonymphae TaxID=3033793 RepID=A0AA48I9T9_9FIRM|nr:MAG: response regulator transcription factor [Candidatus Paraimprobicoccus trichonymphae]
MYRQNNLVYIADDESNVRKTVSVALNEQGFETQEFSSGKDLLIAINKKKPDLIILDLIMPDVDGLAVCGRLNLEKETKSIPIIVLTAKSEEVDCILALEMGADDYVTKPFGLRELCARVKSVIRRNDNLKINLDVEEIINIGEISINLAKRTITKRGSFVELTTKEFDMFTLLIKSKGRVLNRHQIIQKVWGADCEDNIRTVDVHIRYIRKKIEDEPENPKYVKTLRGVGYKGATEEDFLPSPAVCA